MARTLVQTFNPAVLNARRGKSSRGSKLLDGMLVISKGQALALVTATAANHKQSITATGGTGSAVFDFGGERFTVAGTTTPAALQVILRALPNINGAHVTVTGAGAALTDGALTIEFVNKLAGITQPPIYIVSNGITGATLAVNTAAQVCVPNGRLVAWDPSRIANPSTTAVVGTFTVGGADGLFGAGTYCIQTTWVTAQGETLPSFPKFLTLTAAQHIDIAAITAGNTPDYVTAINVYINGMLCVSLAATAPGTTSAAIANTDIIGPGAVAAGGASVVNAQAGKQLPTENTAFIQTDGRHLFHSFATRAQATDNFGRVYDSSTPAWDNGGLGKPEGDITLGGVYLDSDLVGIAGYEQLFLNQTNGRLVDGVLAADGAEYFFGPEGS